MNVFAQEGASELYSGQLFLHRVMLDAVMYVALYSDFLD